MPRKPESLLTARILKALRDLGGVWFKIHGGWFQGERLPDIVGCYQGLFYGLEVKVPGKHIRPHGTVPPEVGDGVSYRSFVERGATPRQALTLSLIESKGGGVSGVVTAPEEALRIVKQARYRHITIYEGMKWLSSSQAAVKAGLLLGKNQPVSKWKLQTMAASKIIKSKVVDGKTFYDLSPLEGKVKS